MLGVSLLTVALIVWRNAIPRWAGFAFLGLYAAYVASMAA
jgi:Ca2+/Na+ antiporter